jgi:hypothetical protein
MGKEAWYDLGAKNDKKQQGWSRNTERMAGKGREELRAGKAASKLARNTHLDEHHFVDQVTSQRILLCTCDLGCLVAFSREEKKRPEVRVPDRHMGNGKWKWTCQQSGKHRHLRSMAPWKAAFPCPCKDTTYFETKQYRGSKQDQTLYFSSGHFPGIRPSLLAVITGV